MIELYQEIKIFCHFGFEVQGFYELKSLALGQVASAFNKVAHEAGAGYSESRISCKGAHGIPRLNGLAISEVILQITAKIKVVGDYGGYWAHTEFLR